MTDTTATPGESLDAAIAKVVAAVDALATALEAKLAELGEEIIDRVDTASTAVDDLQARWDEFAH